MKLHVSIALLVLLTLSIHSYAQTKPKVVVVPLGGAEAKIATAQFTKNYPGGMYLSTFNDESYFRGTGHEARFNRNSSFVSLALSTPLDLPNGAIIKSLRCYLDDQETAFDYGFNSSVELIRRARTSINEESITSSDLVMTTSGSTSGLETRTTTSFTHPAIDTTNYFYSMFAFLEVATSAGGFVSPPFTAVELYFYGCTIDYDLNVVTVN